jgi:hypothetical protein
LSAKAVQFRPGFGEPPFGIGDLLFNGAQVSGGTSVGGITDQPETVNAGLDVAQVLAKVMNQVDQDIFRRRKSR